MLTAYTTVRFIHIVAACTSFATILIPLIAKKGGDVHRKVGWVFTGGMVIAAFSGLALAALMIIAPLEARPPPSATVDLAAYVGRVRAFAVFLIFIGLLTLSSLHTAIAAIARKKNPQGRLLSVSSILPASLLVGSAVLLVLGVIQLEVRYFFFAAVGVFSGFTDLRFFARPLRTRMSWWYQHMNGMGTATIAAFTAFLVFNANRITQGQMPAAWRFIPWILPAIAGTPAIILWIRHYRRRFDEVA